MVTQDPSNPQSKPRRNQEAAGDLAVVLVTAPAADATSLAQWLIEHRLAACVQVLPVMQSFYRWQGEVTYDEEQLLILKTRRAVFEELSTRLRAKHPYDTPQIVLLECEAEATYARWIAENVVVESTSS